MPPIPAAKTNDTIKALRQRFDNDETLSEFERARLQKEAQVLERVEPDGALFIRAVLAALEGDSATVCTLADKVLAGTSSEVLYNNLTVLLMQLGKMQKAYALCRAGLTHFPASADLLNKTIALAQAFEDTVVLEESLLGWQKLFPKEAPPSVILFETEQRFAALDAKGDEALCAFLDTLPLEAVLVSKREKRIVNELLDGVEP